MRSISWSTELQMRLVNRNVLSVFGNLFSITRFQSVVVHPIRPTALLVMHCTLIPFLEVDKPVLRQSHLFSKG